MEITFNAPKDIVVVSELKRTIDKITIMQLVDNPQSKLVQAQTLELGIITLWSGEEYDTIGQWTDDDVINKINELYS